MTTQPQCALCELENEYKPPVLCLNNINSGMEKLLIWIGRGTMGWNEELLWAEAYAKGRSHKAEIIQDDAGCRSLYFMERKELRDFRKQEHSPQQWWSRKWYMKSILKQESCKAWEDGWQITTFIHSCLWLVIIGSGSYNWLYLLLMLACVFLTEYLGGTVSNKYSPFRWFVKHHLGNETKVGYQKKC